MVAADARTELLAIVGPTASGKSALAMEVARLVPAEIIAADSRTIYKGMDIGTAKPAAKEQKIVPHWGLDLLEPGVAFSAHDFQLYAKAKIKEVKERKKLPLLVGGSGLYIDSVVYDFEFTDSVTNERQSLENLSLEELQQVILSQKLPMPENKLNKRHLVRTIERRGQRGSKKVLAPGTLIIGLMPTDEVLKTNIGKRAKAIFVGGIIEEAKELLDKYGEQAILATGGIVYKICIRVIKGEISEQTATTFFRTADWQYARRQKTWFKKNNDIVWFTDKELALDYLKTVLNT
jgi:tRNA dimethylallyltransferase